MGNKGRAEGSNKDILPFRDGLFELEQDGTGYLMANRCRRCKITFFPKRDFCIKCFKDDGLENIRLSTRGKLHTFSVVYRTLPDFPTPYIIGYIDLEKDGVRVFAPIDDCEPEDLQIGMEMELAFGKRIKKPADENDKRLLAYKFRPVR
jgi:uncharacterized OB-fold protein